jgi:hypothetical protein
MNKLTSWIRRTVVYAGFATLAVSQQTPSEQPFQAVHMIASTQAGDEKKLVAAMDDLNNGIAKGGCPPCIYHLWKTSGQRSGPFNYLWISNWPGRAIYEKVHAAREYIDATGRHPEIAAIRSGEIYNRYVEVKLGN